MSYVLTTDQVASLMNYSSAEAFRRARKTLEGANFPKPLPGTRGRYSAHAVKQWVNSNGQQSELFYEQDGQLDLVDAVQDAQRNLMARYASPQPAANASLNALGQGVLV